MWSRSNGTISVDFVDDDEDDDEDEDARMRMGVRGLKREGGKKRPKRGRDIDIYGSLKRQRKGSGGEVRSPNWARARRSIRRGGRRGQGAKVD